MSDLVERLLHSPLDLTSCFQLFSTVKHTRLEGMIVENEMEQALLRRAAEHQWREIDALVLRRLLPNGGQEILVIPRSTSTDIDALVNGLSKTRLPVKRLELHDGTLIDHQNANRVEFRPVQGAETASPSAVSMDRVLAAYWGFAVQAPQLVTRFVRDTLIKDYFIGPVSRALWDLDRFLIGPGGQLLFIEVKHKFPFVRQDVLCFGMNTGEVQQTQTLTAAGFLAYHVILVKPIWEKAKSSMYLFFDRIARERAMWIVADMTAAGFFAGEIGTAPAATALHGRNPIDFVVLPITSFCALGYNSQPAKVLSKRLFGLLSGAQLPPVTAEDLLRARIRL